MRRPALRHVVVTIDEYPDYSKATQNDWQQLDATLQRVQYSGPGWKFRFFVASRVPRSDNSAILADDYTVAEPKEPWFEDIPRFLPETVTKGVPKVYLLQWTTEGWGTAQLMN